MKCCSECFANEVARRFIADRHETGTCAFCGSKSVPVIEASELKCLFEPLFGLYDLDELFYHQADKGVGNFPSQSLFEIIEEGDGWGVFCDLLDMDTGNRLLDEIRFGDLPQAQRQFIHEAEAAWCRAEHNPLGVPPEMEWEAFASYIKHRRRFIPERGHDAVIGRPDEWLPKAVLDNHAVVAVQQGDIFYRARKGSVLVKSLLHDERIPLPTTEMGVPPVELITKGGRANPAGIAYLYLAKEERTAVAEVRPGIGEEVSVRQFRAKETLKLVDLQKFLAPPQPLGTKDLKERVKRNQLLRHLNYELSRPVRPSDSEIEYVPAQYLSEVIAHAGYDGLYYRSAMCKDGTNLVVFPHWKLEAIEKSARLVTISGIQFDYF